MSSKFVKKLQKDIKKSPGKATVLAVLLGVAVWFWSPLVLGLFGGASTPPAQATGATENSTTAQATNSSTSISAQPQYTWKQIAAAIDRDPKMRPAGLLALPRDTFRELTPEKPKDHVEPIAIEPPPVVLDIPPRDAGLVLTSTIVSPARRVARVNGKTYREGDLIRGSVGDKPLDYKLISVGGRNIVLALGSQEYDLRMVKPQQISTNANTVGVSSDSPEFDPAVLE